MSGMPDLLLTFANPDVISDVQFHQCVRYQRFKEERVISFIPPDGEFLFATYRVNVPVERCLPMAFNTKSILANEGGKFELSVHLNPNYGRPIQDLRVVFPVPCNPASAHCSCNSGKAMYDHATQCVIWEAGKVSVWKRTPMVTGSFIFGDTAPKETYAGGITSTFKVERFTLSGLRVASLELYGEVYKFDKGVRFTTKAGHYEART